MKFSKFVSTYCIKGKKWDWDSVANVQCVDLAKAYFQMCFGVPTKKGQAVWGNACDYWNIPSPLKNHFYRVDNSADFVAIEGDVPIWGKNYSSSHNCGHIAIATGNSTMLKFEVWEQNRQGKNDGVGKNMQTYEKDFKGVLRPYRFVSKAVNIRSGPGTKYECLGELPKGQKIQIWKKVGNWYKISEDKQKWISSAYVREIGF